VPLPTAAGALWLCGKHAVGPDVGAVMAEIGATTIVCLTERFELADRYPDYVTWLDANVGGRAIWFPIPDLHAPDVDSVLTLTTEIRDRVARGESVLVHCAAGIGRAGTLAACLLVTMGMSRDEALAHVGQHRPMAGPEVGAQRTLVDTVAERAR
jgi:protein-tyrosine phosphatase